MEAADPFETLAAIGCET